MDRVIIYVDDAAHALAQVADLRAAGVNPTHWVLAACPPRMTSRISKWVSHSARENWRSKWYARLQETLVPALTQDGAQFTAVMAKGELLELTQQLLLVHGAARVVDMRRPKVGMQMEPLQASDAASSREPRDANGRRRGGVFSGGTLSLGALFVLATALGE